MVPKEDDMEETVINIFKSRAISQEEYTSIWAELIMALERRDKAVTLKNEE